MKECLDLGAEPSTAAPARLRHLPSQGKPTEKLNSPLRRRKRKNLPKDLGFVQCLLCVGWAAIVRAAGYVINRGKEKKLGVF